MSDPKATMESIIHHLQAAKKELDAVHSLFEEFPRASKYGTLRMSKIDEARKIIHVAQSNLILDWPKSPWFIEEEHSEYLEKLHLGILE
jgi:hypothetical protein